MIRCIRIWTGDDRNSHFQEGFLDLEPSRRGDVLSSGMATTTVSFEETASGGAFAWHTAPTRQLVMAIGVLQKCFPDELTDGAWLPRLREIIPSYGISLIDDADVLRRARADTAAVLKIENV
jgi:hypothetical protein